MKSKRQMWISVKTCQCRELEIPKIEYSLHSVIKQRSSKFHVSVEEH